MKRVNAVIVLCILGWLVAFGLTMTRLYPGFWHEAYDYYVEARFHEQHGRFHEAIEVMDRALLRSPDDLGYLTAKGYLLLRVGDSTGAQNIFQKVLEKDPGNVEARYGLVDVYRGQGKREDMYRELCLVPVAKEDAEALRRRGQVLSELGMSQKALEDQCLALDVLPENAGLLWEAASSASANGDWAKAESLYARLEKRALEAGDHVLHRQAILGHAAALRAMNRPADAAAAYAKAPGNDTLRPRAELALQLEHFDEAVSLYGQLTEMEPNDRAARGSLAYALDRNGRTDEAENTYRAMQASGPLEGEDAIRFAWLLNRRQQYKDALAVLDAVPQRTPAITALRSQTASWASGATSGKTTAAAMAQEQQLLTRIKANPEDIDSRMALAALYANSGRILQAETEYKAILARRPNHPPALIQLAEMYERHGRSAESIPLYTAAANKVGGGSPQLALRAGRAMSWNGRHAESLPWLRRAVAQLPKGKLRDEARLLLGNSLLEVRQPREALTVLRPLAQEKPSDPAVQLTAARAASDAGEQATATSYLERLGRIRKLSKAERTWLADMQAGRQAGRQAVATASAAGSASAAAGAATTAGKAVSSQETLGDQRLDVGDGKGALEAYAATPEADRSSMYHLKVARAAQVAGQLNLARSSFERALAADPGNTGLALEAARFYVTVHESNRALTLYRQVLDARGDKVDAAFARELAVANIAAQRPHDAEAWARKILETNPADWRATLLLAQSLHLQGKVEAADDILQANRAKLENSPEAVELMGMVAMARDRHLEAFNHFDRLTRMDGASKKKAWLWRGNAARARGDYARADESYAMAEQARN